MPVCIPVTAQMTKESPFFKKQEENCQIRCDAGRMESRTSCQLCPANYVQLSILNAFAHRRE